MLNRLSLTLPQIDTGPFDLSARSTGGITFEQFVRRLNPSLLRYWHVRKLVSVLQRVADGEIARLMIFEPPRHFKSEVVSRLFSAYYLQRFPDRWVGLNSYAASLAYTLSRNARDYFRRIGGALNPEKTGVEQWETMQGGGMWAAGAGGSQTGKGFHLGIIDDPVKNAEEAASSTIRNKHKDWYQSTFYTRAAPVNAIIDIQTRWNEDDLSGWLLAQEGSEDDDPERWHIVCLPAIAEKSPKIPPTCTLEPDERKPGDALCPERYSVERLRKIEKRIGSYFFGALYQQRPAPLAGGLFKRKDFAVIHALPAGCSFVRYWDKAATPDGGDYSVGLLMARSAARRYIVVDVVRGQWSPGERKRIERQTAELDKLKYGHVAVRGEQEPGSSGVESAQASVENLAGFDVRFERVTGDKTTRAMPFAAQCEAGNVDLLAGDWNAVYLDELTVFPNGKYDDQCDGSSGAFAKLAGSGMDSDELAEMFGWRA